MRSALIFSIFPAGRGLKLTASCASVIFHGKDGDIMNKAAIQDGARGTRDFGACLSEFKNN
jgi:hypothetical protein